MRQFTQCFPSYVVHLCANNCNCNIHYNEQPDWYIRYNNLVLPITAYSPFPFVCAPRPANRPLQPSVLTLTSLRNMLYKFITATISYKTLTRAIRTSVMLGKPSSVPYTSRPLRFSANIMLRKKPGSPSLPSTLLKIEELPDYVVINLKSND